MVLHLHTGAPAPATDLSLLGCVVHAIDAAVDATGMRVPVESLLQGAAAEYWYCDGPVESRELDGVQMRVGEDFMFAFLRLDERQSADAEAATRDVYTRLLAAMRAAGFEHLLRCWNYVPAINADGIDGETGLPLENYRLFNRGRQQAYAAAGQSFEQGSPAACAVGSHAGGLCVYVLASRVAPQAIENPRQISAYRYPPQYGPRSPSFSRAALLRMPAQALLFVSGTASIVGHESLHPGNVVAQTQEALRNIEILVERANASATLGHFSMAGLDCKVFVRHPADVPQIARALREHVPGLANALFLHADICRAELLVEIEAVGCAK